ncbi:MAG: hypothetical protein ACI8RD_014310, partial [Bacillariaceae sp.]
MSLQAKMIDGSSLPVAPYKYRHNFITEKDEDYF